MEEVEIRVLIVRKRRWSIHPATANFTDKLDFEKKKRECLMRRRFVSTVNVSHVKPI